MRFLFLLSFLHTISFIQLCSTNNSELGNQRHVCIMADLTCQEIANRRFASCAAQLCSELNAQAAPLIVTKTTWQALLKYAKEKNPQELKNWDVYSYNNFLLIFIPHSYKKKCAACTSQDIGLNLEKCTKIQDPLLLYTLSFLQTCIDYVYHSFTNDILLRNIAIPYYSSRFIGALQELILTKQVRPYSWNILLTGHGLVAPLLMSTTCGLDTTHFKKFLQFLQTAIHTRILIYETCFGGTKRLLHDLYHANKIPDRYNFPIVCTCLTDAPAYYCQRTTSDSVFNHIDKVDLKHKSSAALLSALNASTVLFDLTPQNTKKLTRYTFNNCPQIRWAHASSFRVATIDTLISSLSQLAEQQKPGYFTTLRVTTPGLVIDQPIIPYILELSQGEQHRIASSIAGPACHALYQCRVPTEFKEFKPHVLLSLFSNTVKKLATPKLFLIDTVVYTANNKPEQLTSVLIFINACTPETHRSQAVDELFYLKDNTGYCVRYKKGTYTIKTVSPVITQKYLRIFKQEKTRLHA